MNPEEAEIAQAMLGQSRTLTVVADSSKLGKTAIFQVCDLKRIQRMVLDEPGQAPLPRPCRRRASRSSSRNDRVCGGPPPQTRQLQKRVPPEKRKAWILSPPYLMPVVGSRQPSSFVSA
ncbi:hypothetical protein [Bosea psychrotolerans]|uniref:hypothetical protein n=1 Tax=Bosea psychrotolerans TaxID=1871628 RepID=UPI003CCBF904